MIGRDPSTVQHVFFRDIERLELLTGSGNDIVYGSTRDDVIVTGDGSDAIATTLSSAVIDGGAGRDLVTIDNSGAVEEAGDRFVALLRDAASRART